MKQDRVFSEQEVTDIMRRAVVLQEKSATAETAYRPGVTTDELRRAAKEMGVEPKFLEAAISENLAGGGSKGKPLQEESRVVDGELNPDDFDVVLEQVRTVVSRRHPMTQIGRSLRGRAFSGSGLVNLDVTSRNGRTRIEVKPMIIFEALGMFYPAFILTMLANERLLAAGQPTAALAATGGLFGLAALGFWGWLGKSKAAARRLADKIQEAVEEHLSSQREKPLSGRLVGSAQVEPLRAEEGKVDA